VGDPEPARVNAAATDGFGSFRSAACRPRLVGLGHHPVKAYGARQGADSGEVRCEFPSLTVGVLCHHLVDKGIFVNVSLTTMQMESPSIAHDLDVLMTNVRDLLDSPDAGTRVRAVHSLAVGLGMLERRVLNDAHASGTTWAEIGRVYGVSRQAVHRRFAETVAPAEFFDELLAALDEPPEVVSTLAHAGKRARHASEKR